MTINPADVVTQLTKENYSDFLRAIKGVIKKETENRKGSLEGDILSHVKRVGYGSCADLARVQTANYSCS